MSTETYPCSRCCGKGRISAFGHVLGGVCFKCNGSGTQKSKPVVSAKWAVFGHDRNTGEAGRLYNVRAKNEVKAIEKAETMYARASTEFKDQWSLSNAFTMSWDEADAMEDEK